MSPRTREIATTSGQAPRAMIEGEAPRTWPEAVANFEKRLDGASSDLAAYLRDKTQPPSNVQVRVRQLAVDCVASSATLRAEHEAAVRANAEAHPGSRVLLRVATGGSGMTSSGSDRLVVAYKSVFFYVRAYQDELYRLLLATLPGA